MKNSSLELHRPGRSADQLARATSGISACRRRRSAQLPQSADPHPCGRPARAALGSASRSWFLLTATPVNNSLWDLFHLLRFFVRQDAFLAERGILSVKERFERAAREDPRHLVSGCALSGDRRDNFVKRTRQFVKKHYGGDTIRLPDGQIVTIVFPAPQAITVRYRVTGPLSDLFDMIEELLDPDQGPNAIYFTRYTPDLWLLGDGQGQDDEAQAAATVGLLRSGLLKRFELSAYAFDRTLTKLIGEHRSFLDALAKGHVVSTRFLRELAASDELSLDDLLAASSNVAPAGLYDIKKLRAVVEADLRKLEGLLARCREITPRADPKIEALIDALEAIAEQARGSGGQRRGRATEAQSDYFFFFCRHGRLS